MVKPPKSSVALFAGAMLAASDVYDIAAFAGAGVVPDRVLLMPFGANELGDGRGTIHLHDHAHAERVVAATLKALGKRKLMFDYDHAAVKVADDSVIGQAIAAGWANKGFEIDATGIWALVDWTPAASAKIAAGEYRYISPWFFAHNKTGDLVSFINAALVNRPAFNLEAIAASLSQPETEEMDLTALAAALGLAAGADEAAILAAIAKRNQTHTAVAAALKAGEGDDLVAAVTALAASATGTAPDPAKFVPISMLDQVRAEVAALTKVRHDELITAATASGKIAPAPDAQAWARGYLAKEGEVAFAAYLNVTPSLVSPGRTGPTGQGSTGAGVADQDDVAICAMLGVKPEDYLETRKQEAA